MIDPRTLPPSVRRVQSRGQGSRGQGQRTAAARGRLAPAAAPVSVRTILPDAPGADYLLVPPEYGLAPDLLVEWLKSVDVDNDPEQKGRRSRSSADPAARPEWRVVLHAPVLITRRFTEIDTGNEYLTIAWHRTGSGWNEVTVPRNVIFDARNIVSLAARGLPVASENSKKLVRYLLAFDALNYHRLPTTTLTHRLGYHRGIGYLLGYECYPRDGAPPYDARRDTAPLVFHPFDGGDEQIVCGYVSRGTCQGWVQAIAPLARYPIAVLALYTSCVPPLLQILEAPNFIVNFAGRTSIGKTITLRIAASVWGRPDELHPESAISTWDTTRVWVERAGSILHDLPLILDDSKRAKSKDQIADILYLVASGRGRTRGSLQSVQKTSTWHTVLISSGESRITSFSQDGGARARVLEIVGSPFGAENEETGKLVEQINKTIREHFGHAGRVLVRWLMANKDKIPELRREFNRLVEEHSAGIGPARRYAHAAAAITVAAAVLHAAMADHGCPLPWPTPRDPLASIWPDLIAAAGEAAPEVRALAAVYSWSLAHEAEFLPRGRADRPPATGWVGRWDTGNWQYIAFYPTQLDRVLRDLGYHPDEVITGWKSRGWLLTDDPKRRTHKIRVGTGNNESVRMICLRRTAIEREVIAGGTE